MKIHAYLLKYYTRKLALAAGCVLVLLSMAACSEEKAPDVPKEQSDLLFDALNDLEQKKYDSALPKLRKYSEIDSTNILIERMISQTTTNSFVVQLRALLDQGRFAEAEQLMKSMLAQHDSLEDRVQLRDFSAQLNHTDKVIADLAKVQNSKSLRSNALKLKACAESGLGSDFITKYAERKIKAADELEKIEKDRRIIWPWLDACDAKKNGDEERAELLRIYLAAQLPNAFGDPMVREIATGK